jgi:hypothetical protein
MQAIKVESLKVINSVSDWHSEVGGERKLKERIEMRGTSQSTHSSFSLESIRKESQINE